MRGISIFEKAIGLIAAIIFVSLGAFVALDATVLSDNSASNNDLYEINSDHLYLDGRDYVDYAEVCDYDYDKYPILMEQGLFWHTWNESTQRVVEAPADSALGASYVDPEKPTMIFIHGMEASGYHIRNTYWIPDFLDGRNELNVANEVEEGNPVSMLYLWLRAGWNVGFFHWERFSSGLGTSFGESPINNEERIWATDGKSGTRFVSTDGKGYFDGTEYCVAEHFVAEYIRAMRLLPDTMGDQEIRIQAHSMGGEVTAAGLFLLTELAHPDVNQLPKKQLPDRYSLIDTYFSMYFYVNGIPIPMTVNDITISWSKKPLPENGMKDTVIDCLKVFANHGIAMDYYTYNGSALKIGLTPSDVETILQFMCITDLNIDWASYYPSGGLSQVGWITANGHVAMLYWAASSKALGDYCLDVTNGISSGEKAPSLYMSNEEIKALAGKYYLLSGGKQTFTCEDDTFTQPGLEVLMEGFVLPV